MNVVKGRGKRKNPDFNDFNGINLLLNNADDRQNETMTVATRGNSVARQSSTYVCITSGRGYAHGEIGIAYIDIECPAVKLAQLSDDPWYTGLLTKLNIIEPCQIILPHTIHEAKPETADGKLMKFLSEVYPANIFVKVPRRHFAESDGNDFVTKYCSDKYNFVKEAITTKYYALSAVAGLSKYLQYIHNVFFKENSLKLEFGTKYAHMQIDIETAFKLELLTRKNPNSVNTIYPSLFDVLNYCVTSLGKRTLRAKVLEPICDIPSIQLIHDCIDELRHPDHVNLSPLLINILRKFNNIERLHKLAMVIPQDDNIRAAEILINQTLQLRNCLHLVPVLRDKLATLESQQFREIFENLHDIRYQTMLNNIETVVNPNMMEIRGNASSQLNARINCIQSNVNGLIDELRKSYSDLVGKVEDLITGLSVKYGQVFRMNYTGQRGFHCQLMIPNQAVLQQFNDELEVIDMKGNSCFLSTTELNKLNIRLKGVIEEITMQSNVVIAVMLTEIVKEIDAIYDLSGFTATLDIILSLTTVSTHEGYVRPTFGDEMRVVDANHPLIEHNIHRTVATPNNVIATPDYNFYIITGPNMSGKTVYIKMIAVLQVMAQLGAYVPARSAQFRITDRIFSRIGFNDSIEKNASTFVVEMNNMEHILKNVTPNSLVIIDELCRSTNPKEGTQLAWNMCEHLCSIRGISNDGQYFLEGDEDNPQATGTTESGNTPIGSIGGKKSTSAHSFDWKNAKLNQITTPFVYLTTHYHSLTKLADVYFNVVNLSFSAEEIVNPDEEVSLKYNHRIQEGVTTTSSYGLALAKTVRFPSDVLQRANEIHREIVTGESTQNTNPKIHPNRQLSNIGREILNGIPNSDVGSFDVADSVAELAIRGIQQPNQRMFPRYNAKSVRSTTITSTDFDEDHLKIDRIMYNLYGDIASITRKVQCDYEHFKNVGINVEIPMRVAQNNAIKQFLAEFISEQPESLITAISNLNLSSTSESVNKSAPNGSNASGTSKSAAVPTTSNTTIQNGANMNRVESTVAATAGSQHCFVQPLPPQRPSKNVNRHDELKNNHMNMMPAPSPVARKKSRIPPTDFELPSYQEFEENIKSPFSIPRNRMGIHGNVTFDDFDQNFHQMETGDNENDDEIDIPSLSPPNFMMTSMPSVSIQSNQRSFYLNESSAELSSSLILANSDNWSSYDNNEFNTFGDKDDLNLSGNHQAMTSRFFQQEGNEFSQHSDGYASSLLSNDRFSNLNSGSLKERLSRALSEDKYVSPTSASSEPIVDKSKMLPGRFLSPVLIASASISSRSDEPSSDDRSVTSTNFSKKPLPIVNKSKLKNPTVFGNDWQSFDKEETQRHRPIHSKAVLDSQKFLEKYSGTGTNYTKALERLKTIRKNSEKAVNTFNATSTEVQPSRSDRQHTTEQNSVAAINGSNQAKSNDQESDKATKGNETVDNSPIGTILSPPPEFK